MLQPIKVADDIYALVGPLGQRDAANAGDNATFGAIVTPNGVILIDSGAGDAGARLIAQTLRGVTDKPVRWVINTGSQDHRWLGNAWFASKGAQIIAMASTVKVEKANADQEMQALKMQFGGKMEDFSPMTSPAPLPGDEARLTLGGVPLELRHFGTGHFPGDAVVWLPKQRIAFTGDLVFLDRMLGVLDNGSRVDQWAQTFNTFAATLKPAIIVPGHGKPGTLAQAQAQTGDYLDWLVREVKPAAENMDDLEKTVNRVNAATPQTFRKLYNADQLNRKNINRAYLEFQFQ
ncbi:MAG: MBL fold metallo-hydrolase [Thiomonas sp.]|uniref:MBL fold metallo-hydrolase n=1 Tax=Thiomonas sp. TaxID=2047785 RepID=UPI002A35BB9E|nr:MBL fold metallo-hydrolase [Thiomonas sp.]MDY0331496.1 MBL fold metallo-hydrolase [Thiomonas sp.]